MRRMHALRLAFSFGRVVGSHGSVSSEMILTPSAAKRRVVAREAADPLPVVSFAMDQEGRTHPHGKGGQR